MSEMRPGVSGRGCVPLPLCLGKPVLVCVVHVHTILNKEEGGSQEMTIHLEDFQEARGAIWVS